jgi:hypothetical protein
MNEKWPRRRFLRDDKVHKLRRETEGLLGQLNRTLTLQAKMDFVFDYIQDETLGRLDRGCHTLSGIEAAISSLRQISPPGSDAIATLVSTASQVQAELEGIRESLIILLWTLRKEAARVDGA